VDELSHGEVQSTAALLERLGQPGRRGADEAWPDVANALERAVCAAPAEEASRLDQAAIRALAASPGASGLLGRVSLDGLAGLADRCERRLTADGSGSDPAPRRTARELLDLLRRPAVLRRIGPDETDAWAARMLRLIEASHLTVGPLLRQRAELYGSKVLFEDDSSGRSGTWSWRRVVSRVEFYSRVLLSLDRSNDPAPIAILSENRIEMALLDLACLSAGLVNVMVPANATETDVGYILGHSRAGAVIVSGPHQLAKVLKHRDMLAHLETVVILDPPNSDVPDVVSLEKLAPRAESVPRSAPHERSERVRIDDLATVMYTSGTTGTPKAIPFTHRNIVFKRFARALALPEIGEDDVFLCFLPLYHTFGRFLELLGCVFWGATYCFLEGTSPERLARGMRRFRPSVFVSVPKKWMQLHEMITRLADPDEASDEELRAATERTTGGRLRWGLSAAGHLDSDIFRFFQHQGIELMSGFGMTEATGGITMTPPGQYEEGSLGVELPGIEVRLAEDGELLVRGPYVMTGYLDPPRDEAAFNDEGWLHTGDLMQVSSGGHLRLIDRKKEIYKNTRGETIAPQRVENMFREFESVGRAFLVGDHRDYNTLLIHPNPDYAELDLGALSEQEVHDHFRSLVVSSNQFLAPYERVVDFAIVTRDLDEQRGELTPKGTPRRKVVEQNFQDVISQLYRRTSLRIAGVELIIPNWLFQILGLTARDIRVGEEAIMLPSSGTRLTVQARGPELVRVGSCVYRHPAGPLDLGALLTAPRLWLGNEELVAFVALDTVTRQRSSQREQGIDWIDRPAPYVPEEQDRQTLESYLGRDDLDVLDLHCAARMLAAASQVDALLAIRVLEEILEREADPLSELSRLLLARTAGAERSRVRRRGFQVLVPAEEDTRFGEVLHGFVDRDPDLFDAETRLTLSEQMLSGEKLETFIACARGACSSEAPERDRRRLARGLLGFLAAYGAVHPTGYRRIRAFLTRMSLFAGTDDLRNEARRAGGELLEGFRSWLGATDRIAVDPDGGREYRWENVVVFDDGVPQLDRQRLISAMKRTAFIREAVFLFSPGVSVRLSDIVSGGVRVRVLGRLHGKSVYRVSVQTRFQGSFDLAVNVNHDLPAAQIQEEIHWLILSGDPGYGRGALVEEFGGYWSEQDLWSEEFIAGETLSRAMRRLARLPDHQERLGRLWPFMAWATLSAYVDFWHRSGKRLEIADPNMANIVVPTQDFISGVRIVSVSRRRPHRGLPAMLRAFRDEFVAQAEEQYPFLAGLVGWPVVCSSVLEVLGEDEGLALLGEALGEPGASDADELRTALRAYMANVSERGFMPLRLFFAVERFRRWTKLSADATRRARALTLQELYETYGLERMAKTYPETRVRFYLETVFKDCSPTLADGLKRVIRGIRDGELAPADLREAVDQLRAEPDLGPDDEYFLARLSYPYLRPEDEADFVRTDLGGRRQSDIVVTLEDSDGGVFRVRHVLNPKEVERLLQLFVAAKLDVRFRMEHQYLVAINERSRIIGGIYYEVEENGRSAHLEKIVAAERYRGKRVAHGLMTELFNRLRSADVKTLTTGFFRPDYFERYGFRVEKRHAGLVKDLAGEDPAPDLR
jgi:long-subunit acyl-CoA synthetase (AMP-forming)/N-acetylglutamate synthase-like GNAT family acetyltransferase